MKAARCAHPCIRVCKMSSVQVIALFCKRNIRLGVVSVLGIRHGSGSGSVTEKLKQSVGFCVADREEDQKYS